MYRPRDSVVRPGPKAQPNTSSHWTTVFHHFMQHPTRHHSRLATCDGHNLRLLTSANKNNSRLGRTPATPAAQLQSRHCVAQLDRHAQLCRTVWLLPHLRIRYCAIALAAPKAATCSWEPTSLPNTIQPGHTSLGLLLVRSQQAQHQQSLIRCLCACHNHSSAVQNCSTPVSTCLLTSKTLKFVLQISSAAASLKHSIHCTCGPLTDMGSPNNPQQSFKRACNTTFTTDIIMDISATPNQHVEPTNSPVMHSKQLSLLGKH